MDVDNNDPLKSSVQEIEDRPLIAFESVTFSDGTTVEIEPDDVVVLVGPNNAGKSLALRELQEHIGGKPGSKVVSTAKVHMLGTPDVFEEFVRNNTRVETSDARNSISVRGYQLSLGIGSATLRSYWPDNIGMFRPLFCLSIPTESRITDSDPPDAIDYLNEPPSNPIHLLNDDSVEERISGYFRRAFGLDLILYRAGGRKSHLLVGDRPVPVGQEDRVSTSFVKRLLESCVSLETQGDGMRSFASVILHLLAPGTPSILFLDEPEAFLHPPQAKLLGEIIATEKLDQAQLFVATHSPDVLQGIVGVAPDNLKVLRIQRDGNVNQVKELDKEIVKQISFNPLMRYTSVLSGVFHQRVFICEGDSDCLFYNSILAIPEVHGGSYPDVLFINAGGKYQISTLAKALRSLGVQADAVVDMDVLNNMNVLQGIVESLDGSWSSVEPSAKAIKTAVEEQSPPLSLAEVKESVREILDVEPSAGEPLYQLKREIDAQFRKASPWQAIKSAGQQALPAGEATRHFRELQTLCRSIGLWIVPVGEIEGFCKVIGGRGPRWVQRVVEEYDLSSAPELEDARNFMHEVWVSRNKMEF